MANICCDDVIFYTEGNPEGLYDLWEDLETYIILNQNPDLCWIGNLFSHKKIDSTGISLRGNVSYMEWNDTYILLSLETAWTPLYEAYQAIDQKALCRISCSLCDAKHRTWRTNLL